MNILVLETSTTSAKALLYNTDTKTYQWESKPFDKLSFDGRTHNPKDVFDDTIETALALLNRVGFKDKIEVISIVTTWHSLMISNKNLSEVSTCYLWSSLIGQPYVGKLIDINSLNSKTGCVASGMYPFYKVQYLNDCGLINDDSLILDQGSYNYYQLSGELLTTAEMASGTCFYNSVESTYDHEILKLVGIKENQLPPIYSGEKNKYKSNVNKLLDKFMTKDTIVLPATPDGGMNQLGSVGLALNKMTLSVGTSGALRVLSTKHLHSKNASTWSYSLNGQALIGAATSGACNCIDDVKNDWFKDSTYTEIERLLTKSDLVYSDTMFLPFTYGERSPGFNNNRKSGFVGPKKLPIEMYEIALEGVLFNLYHCYLDIINLVGKPDEIHLSGGILNSNYWSQMCADVFNEPIIIDQVIHSSMYGGIVFTCHELGLDINELFTTNHKVVMPEIKNKTYYEKRFERYILLYNQN